MSGLSSEVAAVLDRIPIDVGGGCSLRKAYAMAWLIRRYGLATSVDIGVYRGRSLFPQAVAHRRYTGGTVYGVDPWSASEAVENDSPRRKKKAVKRFVERTDFQAVYESVASLNSGLGLEDHCVLLRQTSAKAADYFKHNGTFFDLVHVDGNHDTVRVMEDVELYLPRLNRGGFIVLDDISWDSVRPAYDRVKSETSLVFERVDDGDDYAVFWNGRAPLGVLSRRLSLRYIGGVRGGAARRSRVPSRGKGGQGARAFELRKTFEPVPGATVFFDLKAGVVREAPEPGGAPGGQQSGPRPGPEHRSAGGRSRRLVIFDNVFPHPLSPFRIAEYNAYLDTWADAVAYSSAEGFRPLREKRSFEEIHDEYASRYPRPAKRVFKVGTGDLGSRISGGDLVYTLFLRNAARSLEVVHKRGVPLVFTLYPGGGFGLDQEKTDARLHEVCSSPNLAKVIVTQKITRDYLLDRKFLEPEKIEFIYGGVFPSDRLLRRDVPRKRYGREKSTFDVCFVAHKYMDRGVDKGYDVFVEVAKLLSKAHDDVFFHVVGPFDESDIDVGDVAAGKIRFYGTRQTEFFPEFYSRMDVILSPNLPFVRRPGAFDGFPTGSCIEAGLCGVAVLCTDPLRQNVAFGDGEEIVIVPRQAEAICETIIRYHGCPESLYELAARGQRAFARVFDVEAQMKPRLRILSELLKGG